MSKMSKIHKETSDKKFDFAVKMKFDRTLF